MATDPDPIIERAKRHVREGEEQVLRQRQLIAELEKAGSHDTARMARELLALLINSLDAAKAHLAQERRYRQGTS